ncbi:FAD-dependent oxidoreductase [Nocardia sp. NPDC004860]|uniref:NAD(P)/FAD-dependent oxidoreductase n=1 Tax=Nocardia sp. NPDC004860 TaxID=3154557 RepID=UPI0033A46F0B
MLDSANDIVIVGGGLAAVRTAQGLRNLGYGRPIHLLSEETTAPYDRPPLSKDYLLGELTDEDLGLLNSKTSAALDLSLHLGHRVAALDRAGRSVRLADSTKVPYGQLVVATGATARRLSGLDPSERVHYLRTVDDAARLRQALLSAERVLVIGSGFIGLEVASSARSLGLEVDVVAADEGPMISILGRELSQWVASVHETNGVRITSSVLVSSVTDNSTGITVTLGDGTWRSADLVVVGAGVARELDWLAEAGLAVDRGLICDLDGRTSDPNIFGVGDIVRVRDRLIDEDIQHWTAAVDSAQRTAHALTATPYDPDLGDGFFWTEQFGHRLQFAGSAADGCTLEVLTGSLEQGTFVANVVVDGAVTGVFASNSPREFIRNRMALRKPAPAEGQ